MTPTALDLGAIPPGFSGTAFFLVRNNAQVELAIGQAAGVDALDAPFSFDADTCSGQVLAPFASCAITIAFSPLTEAEFLDTFDLPSNDPEEPTISLTVSGRSTDVPSDLDIRSAWDFGEQPLNSETTYSFRAINLGTGILVFGDIGVADPVEPPFEIVDETCSNSGVLPLEECSITVVYAPVSGTEHMDSFEVSSNDPLEPVVTVQLAGKVAQGEIEFSPLVPFGEIPVGGGRGVGIGVRNVGGGFLEIGNLGATDPLEPPFEVNIDECSGQTLPPNAGDDSTCRLNMAFTPSAVGEFEDTLSIPSSDPDRPNATLTVTGAGVAPSIKTPPLLLFGLQPPGSETTKTVRVGNDGNAPLEIGTVSSVGPAFAVVTDDCSNSSVLPQTTCVMEIAFSPGAAGIFRGRIDIPSNDPVTPTARFFTLGRGAPSE